MWSSRFALISAASSALLLAACASTGGGADRPLTPMERYSISITRQPQELRLAPHPQGLSPTQAAALAAFAREWSAIEGGQITVQAPSGGGDPTAAFRTAEGTRHFLMGQGVAPSQLRVVGYPAGGDPAAPVVVSYVRYTAQGPDCAASWGNVTATASNQPYSNFGCAVTANVAAQIANPGDLVDPRPMDPADAQRRSVMLGHYRAGEVTSSARDEHASGAVSNAVQ
jgi:pilus assembly protein CpaD